MASAFGLLNYVLFLVFVRSVLGLAHQAQSPLVQDAPSNNDTISRKLFFELEELARIVDISYCVGTTGLGIQKPFSCASHCGDEDFKDFELVTAWNTGPLFSDSCGYIALSHPPSRPRIILAFRGTYSLANTIIDLSTIPQKYVPYPGDDDNGSTTFSSSFSQEEPPPADPPKCANCTVHTGFYTSWLHTRSAILPHLTAAISTYPSYEIILVGHSLGGAVAALAALDLRARGWNPRVTTFGEPRVGNAALMRYINERFNISSYGEGRARAREGVRYHRVTHKGDPVPLLPLEEWGYTMHSEELFISRPDLPFAESDIRHCDGDEDGRCIAGADTDDGGWGVPARFKFWELFFAHRDYFWRLGLCVPGGEARGWYRKYAKAPDEEDALENREL
ncbi:alpha/beta-hydrolase [Bimuria novae-zelandiae CBS 107.79]|uniref:Alpha/beta-hydrolase n=1 Tax=Bimuria novae-zelandiae CBS 107.79 TaxID=1447943 RepID=A0A6A5VDK1_9PLEO|nr:alpha/beta-hydrolase [Bimuria novae-zelandiae CBS 107.79]